MLGTETFKVSAAATTPSPKSISQLLFKWRDGDQTAFDRLIPLVYEELRHMAHRRMRQERTGHIFQTSDLVNDAYVRLVNHKGMRWQNRAHFYAVAAQAMRRILVDHARSRNAAKRKADFVDIDRAALVAQESPINLVTLHDVLNELELIDPRKSKIVEMKFFGGMKEKEIAEVLEVSPATVTRDWKTAKIWLLRAMTFKS